MEHQPSTSDPSVGSPTPAEGVGPVPRRASVFERSRSEPSIPWVITYPKAPISNVTDQVAQAAESTSDSESDDELAAYLSSESDNEDGDFTQRLKFRSGVQKPLRVVTPPVQRRPRRGSGSTPTPLPARMSRSVDALLDLSSNLPTVTEQEPQEVNAAVEPAKPAEATTATPGEAPGDRRAVTSTGKSFSPARLISKFISTNLSRPKPTTRSPSSPQQQASELIRPGSPPANQVSFAEPNPAPQSSQPASDASPSKPKRRRKARQKPANSTSAVSETVVVGASPSSASGSPPQKMPSKSHSAAGVALSAPASPPGSPQQGRGKQRAGSVVIKPAFQSMTKIASATDTPLFRHAWNVIDEFEEKRANALDLELEKKVAERLSQLVRRSARMSARDQAFRIATVQVPHDYTGPRLPSPLTPDSVQTLISAFKNRVPIHYRYVQQVFYTELVHLSQHGTTLQRITLLSGGKINVVGDLHGQLQDLLTVLRKHGMPSETNFYLFNGDFVDRGAYGLEVLCLLYAMRQVWPNFVFLNRGNHEQPSMNKRYKFEAQVTQAYDRKLYSIISQTFALLPFAALIDERVFVVHGGLTEFADFSIKDVEEVCDLKEVPLVPKSKGDTLAKQLLWSDPANDPKDPTTAPKLTNGFKANPRGAGILFDSTITASFCERNKVDLVVRSHQMMHNGYKYHHHQKLLTIFSASYYCGKNDNKGAVAVFDKNNLPTPKCVSFYADTIEALEKPGARRPLDKIVSDVLRKIAECVYDHRCDLLMDMSSHSLDGEITLQVWANSMKQFTGLALKWKDLWPHIRYKDAPLYLSPSLAPHLRINYRRFIERFSMRGIPKLWKRQRRHLVATAARLVLAAAPVPQIGLQLRALDEKQTGRLSYGEVGMVVRRLVRGIPRDALFEFICEMDPRRFGFIHINSVLAELDLLQQHQANMQWIWDVLVENGSSGKKNLKQAFLSSPTKSLDAVAIREHIAQLAAGTSTSFVKPFDESKALLIGMLVHQVDLDDDGRVNWLEFKQATRMLAPSPHVEVAPPSRLLRIVRDHYEDLYVTFVSADEEGTGRLDLEEFKSVFQTLVEVKKELQVDDDELEALYHCLCTEPSQQNIAWRDVLHAASILAL